ncbi:MAG: sigma-70 family RNA polymerase sigma factor, partial [Polyangiales bacterium]
MEAYVDGDQAAFRVLFDRYAPILLRLTRRHLRDDELAGEIVQQTFFRLHGARNDFRQGSTLRPWVMTIAMNLVREHWRRTKRRKATAIEVDTQAAPEADFTPMELQQRSELLHLALEKLPTSQREVVELHWFQERPYAEVAAIVGTSEGAVRVRAHRAYATLKQLLVSEVRGDE